MHKGAAGKRSKLHIAVEQIAVDENRKVENAHATAETFRMQVCEGAMHKIAAVKAFVRQVNVHKCHAGGVEADNFVVIFDVIVDFLLSFSRIGGVIEAVVLFIGNVSGCVKGRYRNVST